MAKHSANMQMNKHIHDMSQSDPEQEKSLFRRSIGLGCGIVSSNSALSN